MKTPSPVNVVLVMSDQHSARFLGCAGDALAHTPAADRLARRGARFASAYCPFPLCGPSRMSFLTGQRPSRIDCLDNASQLGSDIPTFAHAFSAGGYETVLSGRMHLVGVDQRHGFERRLLGDVTTAFVNRDWQLAPVLGDLQDTAGYAASGLIKSGPGRTGYQAYDEAVTQATVQWLDAPERATGRPFLLVVGYVSPHCPFVAPPECYARYAGRVALPATGERAPESLHPEMRAIRSIGDSAPQEARIRARTAYYGLCTFVDNQLDAILAALERSGLDERTLVIYTSDHGEMAGEHGLWWKSSFYDGSARVPLLMAGPGIPEGAVLPEHVGLIDLGPTLLDLLGLLRLPSAEGRSFRCLLDGQKERWPDIVTAEGLSPSPRPRAMRMVRAGPWKLNVYHGATPELFHLCDDPEETCDRHADPSCADVLQRLTARALADWDGAAIERRMEARAEELRLIRAYLERATPDEPDPLWYAGQQTNWIGNEED